MLCMYCGKCDPSLTLSGLEDHYKTKCPMLTACPSCSEVIETRYLADHFLYECAKRSEYIQCDRCQLPIYTTLYIKHKSSPKCKITSETIGRCLLCWGDVKTNNDIGWRKHLMQECKANSRKAN